VILGALLTQNTSWNNVEKALGSLRRARLLAPSRLARAPRGRLSRLLRPSGTFRQKTRAVQAFLRHLNNGYRGSLPRLLAQPTTRLRPELLGLRGVGPETADSILLYAARRPVFVIDAYTRRVLVRHGLADERARYETLQNIFHEHLPRRAQLYNEYHALLVAVGKHYCFRRNPDCQACPLGVELESSHAGA
jgi:endonuclease-3 related protein